MISFDNFNQHVGWWHEALPGDSEDFEHEGTLSSFIFEPKLTIGLSNFWNMTIGQQFGNRSMAWMGPSESIHHRDEGTHTDYKNSIGGYLGDTRLTARYLVLNDGQGDGKRWYLGCGFIIPSKNTLTSDPFFLNNQEKENHRHFSLSEGVYKSSFEMQYFKKQSTNPVFYGGTISTTIPISENKYGFKSSYSYDLSLSAFSKPIPLINGSIGSSLIVQQTTAASWNGKEAPNSKTLLATIGGGFLWNLPIGGVTLNIQKPFFLEGGLGGTEGDIDQRIKAIQVSLSYRKMLDWVIPWIDPLKGL